MNKKMWKDKLLRCALAAFLAWCALYTAWLLDVIFSEPAPEPTPIIFEDGGKHDRP